MAETMNEIAKVIAPDSATQATYKNVFPIFEATYQALMPVYDMMAEQYLTHEILVH